MSDGDVLTVLPKDGKAARKDPTGLAPEALLEMHRLMVLVRTLDERAMNLQRQGRIGFCVPSWGEEAVQIGSAWAMEPEDWVFPSYRSHGVALQRGAPLVEMVAQLYGNAADPVKGRQMPNHFAWRRLHYVSVSSPIGTQISQAAGAAIAMRARGDPHAAITYFGDGATSSNDFHAGMNFAGVFRAPCVFVCVNNQWAISVPRPKQTGSETLAGKAVAYGFEGVRVDGNDVLAVYTAVRDAARKARKGGGPTLVEAVTYRMGPHSSSDDPTRYRPKDEYERWKKRDPIDRFRAYLVERDLWDDVREAALRERCAKEVSDSIAAVEKAGPPTVDDLFEDVYATMPPHLEAQRRELRDELVERGEIEDTTEAFPL